MKKSLFFILFVLVLSMIGCSPKESSISIVYSDIEIQPDMEEMIEYAKQYYEIAKLFKGVKRDDFVDLLFLKSTELSVISTNMSNFMTSHNYYSRYKKDIYDVITVIKGKCEKVGSLIRSINEAINQEIKYDSKHMYQKGSYSEDIKLLNTALNDLSAYLDSFKYS